MDPNMAHAGNWVWENGGTYFGVQRRNYLALFTMGIPALLALIQISMSRGVIPAELPRE